MNGKVLRYEHPKFLTYLGWKKEMVLTIKESTKVFNGNQCFQLDNVCDEFNYTETKTSTSKSQLEKKKSFEEYRDYTDLHANYRVLDDFDQKYIIYQNARNFYSITDIDTLDLKGGWTFAQNIANLLNKIHESNIDEAINKILKLK